MSHPDRQGAVFTAHGAAAVRAAGLGGAAIPLLLLKDLRVELLWRKNKSMSEREHERDGEQE